MKYLKLYENFGLPIGRLENTKNLIIDTFADICESEKGISGKLIINGGMIHYVITIMEYLSKNEIINFYDNNISKKIKFLEDKGLAVFIPNLFQKIDYLGEKQYNKCRYYIGHDHTNIYIRFKL